MAFKLDDIIIDRIQYGVAETFDGEFNLGHTANFLEVRIPSELKISNEFVTVKPFAADGDYIYANIVK